MELKKEYENICFKLDKAEKEFEKLKVDLFILNPELVEKIQEIGALKAKKKELEDSMNGQ